MTNTFVGIDGATWLLPTMIAVPLVAALLLLVIGAFGDRLSAWIGFIASIATLAVAVLACTQKSLVFNVPWIPALGVNLHFALDPISIPLVLLTAGLGVLATGYLVHLHADAPGIR